MVKLSCFGGDAIIDDWDIHSHHSGDSTTLQATNNRKNNALFPHKRVLTREAAKQRLKKILNKKKDAPEKEREKDRDHDRPENDQEYIVLAKLYSGLDTKIDLAKISKSRSALSHLLPFLLNSLLYGFNEKVGSAIGNSGRSGRKSSIIKVHRDPKEITLGGTSHLVKKETERQLEQFLYQQAMNSVSFALECLWYITGSLALGPKETYHRTMTLMLGIESVVTNSTPPGDLFKKAGLTETSMNGSSSASTTAPSSSTDQNPETNGKEIVPRHASVREINFDISGTGEHNHRMRFGELGVSDEAKLQQWLDARKERATTFHAQLDFVKCLTHISHGLFEVEHEYRRDVLRRELEKLNDFLPTNVFIPTERKPHRVLRIVPEDAHVFSTKERVPFLLVVEVEDLSPSITERDTSPDGGRGQGPLRRIGSLSHANAHRHQSITKAQLESSTDNIPMQNQPDTKFDFSPDVTAERNSSNPDLKRESSFRVDASYADDHRPPDEELLKALGEPWATKSERLRKVSPHGSNPSWRLISCIVKSRDQLRQEMLAQRLIQEFARIFERADVGVWLRPYQILPTGTDSGLIETLTDAKSIDSIKKHSPNVVTLQDYFVGRFGGRGSSAYRRAVRNFVQSMAGYSIVQYLINIKDRHNGNLMIDADGHVIHIDFGFLLSNSPGGNMEFEKSPFKLTNEMVQVMGGTKSGAWRLFRKLCIQGYLEACRHANKILLMVDIAYPGNETMPCFLQGREYVLENMRERFGVDLSRKERATRMAKLIDQAHGNWTTKAYDHYQKVSLGIAK